MSKARIEIVPAQPVVGDSAFGNGEAPHYLRVVAANGETLAHSEMYVSKGNAKRAAEDWLAAMTEIVHGHSVVEADPKAKGQPKP